MTGSPSSAEILAMSGFDWVAIDIEHTSIDHENIENCIRGIKLYGSEPFVRISSHDAEIIKICLDMGATGLIVPMVNTAEQSRKVVEAIKFPPKGKRGASFSRATDFGNNFNDYYEKFNNEVVIVAMIEDIEGVNNINEIIRVDGIDALFIGPYDLSQSMGIVGKFENSIFIEAIQAIKHASIKFKMPIGIHVVVPDTKQIQKKINEGFQFIGCSIDTQIILNFAQKCSKIS